MTIKERYKYFPVDRLDEMIHKAKGDTIVLFNGKQKSIDDCIYLSDGANRIDLKYPKESFGDIFVKVSLPKNQKSSLVINHIVYGGTGGKIKFDIKLGEGSSLGMVDVTDTFGYIKSEFHYIISSDCKLDVTTVDINNIMLSRNQIFDINAEGSHVNVRGIFISSKGEIVDNYVKMNHNAPRSESYQDVRGISSGDASFLGHIYIAPDSQQSVAMQQSRNIVVGNDAHIYARPWLEIYADDVKCNHGATVGTSDEEALFYLCQRGIPKNAAKALLLEGFVSSVLVSVPALRKKVKSKLYKL